VAANESGDAREPTAPGWFLREQVLRPLNISQRQIARVLGVSAPRLNQILNGRGTITAEMALRLGRVFCTSPEFWLVMKMNVDLFRAKERLRDELANIQPLRRPDPNGGAEWKADGAVPDATCSS
jgi:antitoxin HigA-1